MDLLSQRGGGGGAGGGVVSGIPDRGAAWNGGGQGWGTSEFPDTAAGGQTVT